jgi:hypothetical protein
LKAHLLPRIQAVLQREAETRPELSIAVNMFPPSQDDAAHNFVFFKNESLYQHKTIRFNYTTYDMRRGTDIVKPDGPRCNVMLLADHPGGSNPSNLHHFIYARVLGVYHANVIYTGPGMQDFEARTFQILWVRWYEVVDPGSLGWDSSTLDTLRFPPLHQDNSFGFLDPDDVLRGCHILPAFAKKKRPANVNVSRSAKDSKDYLLYYVGRSVQLFHRESVINPDLNYRFSDRDLLMRYHWGLGVGHLHAHQSTSSYQSKGIDAPHEPVPETLPVSRDTKTTDVNDDDESDNSEIGLEDHEFEGWDDVESDDSNEGGNDSNDQGSDDDNE